MKTFSLLVFGLFFLGLFYSFFSESEKKTYLVLYFENRIRPIAFYEQVSDRCMIMDLIVLGVLEVTCLEAAWDELIFELEKKYSREVVDEIIGDTIICRVTR